MGIRRILDCEFRISKFISRHMNQAPLGFSFDKRFMEPTAARRNFCRSCLSLMALAADHRSNGTSLLDTGLDFLGRARIVVSFGLIRNSIRPTTDWPRMEFTRKSI